MWPPCWKSAICWPRQATDPTTSIVRKIPSKPGKRGWCKPGHEGYYNIYIMEEVQTILSAGAGGSTKLVADGGKRMQRIFNFKYPTEYIQRFDEVLERKKGVAVFYDHDLGTETSG